MHLENNNKEDSMDSKTYRRYGLDKNEPIVKKVGFTVIVESPARSPKGNVRNIKAMSDVKLIHLAKKMNETPYSDSDTRWRDIDEEAWTKVLIESQARGYSLA